MIGIPAKVIYQNKKMVLGPHCFRSRNYVFYSRQCTYLLVFYLAFLCIIKTAPGDISSSEKRAGRIQILYSKNMLNYTGNLELQKKLFTGTDCLHECDH